MPAARPIIIAGAGIGGLTLAIALARRGILSIVIERAPKLEEIGAGLQLSPNASRVLDRLGNRFEILHVDSVRCLPNTQSATRCPTSVTAFRAARQAVASVPCMR